MLNYTWFSNLHFDPHTHLLYVLCKDVVVFFSETGELKLECIQEKSFHSTMRGIDYHYNMDVLALTSNNNILLFPSLLMSPSESIVSLHGSPAIVRFCSDSLLSDNEGPIDIFNLQTKTLTRSYLEHSGRVTGIDWTGSGQSFISSSKDGTVHLYALDSPHSHTTIDMLAAVCGICHNPFYDNHIGFRTAKGKFFIYDVRNSVLPFLEVKGHSKTVSSVLFLSSHEVC